MSTVRLVLLLVGCVLCVLAGWQVTVMQPNSWFISMLVTALALVTLLFIFVLGGGGS